MRRSRKPLYVLLAYREFESLPLRCRWSFSYGVRRPVSARNDQPAGERLPDEPSVRSVFAIL